MSHEYLDMTEPQLSAHMAEIATVLDLLLPENTAFVIMATPFMSSAALQYVSNGSQEDIKKMLEEILSRWDNDPSHVCRVKGEPKQ